MQPPQSREESIDQLICQDEKTQCLTPQNRGGLNTQALNKRQVSMDDAIRKTVQTQLCVPVRSIDQQ